MGSVKLNIYKVELSLIGETHSVVEFASAISFAKDVNGDSEDFNSNNNGDGRVHDDIYDGRVNSNNEYNYDCDGDSGDVDVERINEDVNIDDRPFFKIKKNKSYGIKKKPKSLSGSTAKYRLNSFGGDFLKFSPSGFLRPILNNELFLDPAHNEICTLVSNLDEFIYFKMHPLTLEKSLRMTLLKSDREYDLRLEIVHKEGYSNLKFLKNKIFKRWFFNIDDQAQRFSKHFKNRVDEKEWDLKSEKRKENEIDIPRLKLLQSVFVMRRMIESEYKKQKLKIYNSSRRNATSLWIRMKHFLLRILFIKYANYISHRERLLIFSRKGVSNEKISNYVNLILPSNTKNVFSSSVLAENTFSKDHIEEFKRILKLLPSLEDISDEQIKNCQCSVTLESSLPDIFDKSVINLLRLGKIAFLSCLSVTGIPIQIYDDTFSPDKDLWTFEAALGDDKNIYSLVNKNILDFSTDDSFFKNVFRNFDEERYFNNLGTSIKFNAVIPVFEPEMVNQLELLIKTEVFQPLFSYCITKNPRAVSPGLHFVALVWLWIALMTTKNTQMEYIQKRLKSATAMAKVYADSDLEYQGYKAQLLKSPNLALRKMFELGDDDDARVKSENLAKPLFFAYIYRDEIDESKLLDIFKLVVREFIGRLVSYMTKTSHNPKIVMFNLFWQDENEKFGFCTELYEIGRHLAKKIVENFLKEKYIHHDIDERNEKKEYEILKIYCRAYLSDHNFSRFIDINRKLLFEFKDKENIGDFTLGDLCRIASEQFCLPEKNVLQIFDTKNLFKYVYHSLKNNNDEFAWKKRLEEDVMSYEEAHAEVIVLIREKIQEVMETELNRAYKFKYLNGRDEETGWDIARMDQRDLESMESWGN